jgi:CHASE2 domain-containing sensor protein
MLSREDSLRLAQLERQLQRDDPEFCARMAGGDPIRAPRKRVALALIIATAALWLTAVVFSVLTWWIPAAVAALAATAAAATLTVHLLRRRSRRS